jgi:hypothetical protein
LLVDWRAALLFAFCANIGCAQGMIIYQPLSQCQSLQMDSVPLSKCAVLRQDGMSQAKKVFVRRFKKLYDRYIFDVNHKPP